MVHDMLPLAGFVRYDALVNLLGLLFPVLSSALAASGGPDAGDEVFTDSQEPDGPSHVWLDATGGEAFSLGNDALAPVDLPFSFTFYGQSYDSLELSSNGVIFFGGGGSSAAAGSCPGSSTWTGVAAFWDDLDAGTIYVDTLGTYPWRTTVISWEDVGHRRAPGTGSFQIWLMEGRNEVVLVHQDLDFGDASVDYGAAAVIGTANGSQGLPYSCNAVVTNGNSIWYGEQSGRPARAVVRTDELNSPWQGQGNGDFLGRALAVGDVNADGVDDMLLGAPDRGAGEAYLIYRPDTGSTTDNADASWGGNSNGDDFGYAVGMGDLDGDGVAEMMFGAPSASGGRGGAWIYSGGAWGGSWVTADADREILGDSGFSDALGTVLRGDGDLNGDGYLDLFLGAPQADRAGPDSGRLFIVNGGALGSGSATISASANASFDGAGVGHHLGSSLWVGPVLSGASDTLLVGAPNASRGAVDSGSLYMVPGGNWAGNQDVGTVASCVIDGPDVGMHFGTSLAIGDLDASGSPDLWVGAPNADSSASDLGRAYFWRDQVQTGCPTAANADAVVQGISAAAQLGRQIQISDLNEDGAPDVLLSAPNMTGGATNSGVVYAFTQLPSGSMDADRAQHQISGSWRAGALGTSLGVADDGDMYPTILFSAPYADVGYTHDGAMTGWKYRPDFDDQDADGFVAVSAGGNDCDDSDASANPNGVDAAGDSVDGDCDGWVDGQVRVRRDAEEWSWDLENWNSVGVALEDFEGYNPGDTALGIGGMQLVGGTAAVQVYGTWPRGSQAVQVGGNPNRLTMTFGQNVDGIALRLLDPQDSFTLAATRTGTAVVTGYQFTASADDRTGGLFYSFLFAGEVNSITLEGATADGWGLDNLQVLYSADTDRDGDGWTDVDGDCDDDDAAISPDAAEILGDGIDQDCDGVVDAGVAVVWTTESSWEGAMASEVAALTEIDFDAVSEGALVEDLYLDLGLDCTGLSGAAVIGATAANGVRAATGSRLQLDFTEAQPGLAFTLLDATGTFSLQAYDNGVLAYTQIIRPSSLSQYVAFTFPYSVDRAVISSAGDSDWGIDDLSFGSLGLDDADGDGFYEPTDCDDTEATAYPGAAEIWYNGIDNACDGGDDNDQDGDGVVIGPDCDDEDAAISPSATEIWYDGVDQDCSGGSDDDQDGDGVDLGPDCDDRDAAINPSATEIWYDGVDQDCSGGSDDDADADGVDSPLDCDDTVASTYPGALDLPYDGVDADCSGGSDYDVDADGQDSSSYGGTDCDDSVRDIYAGAPDTCYDGVDQACDGGDDYDCDADGHRSDSYGGDDCNDGISSIYPGASDPTGDGIDQDCDGASDYDADRDGFDDAAYGGADCDDSDRSIYPGAVESCYDGVDQDCAGDDDFDCDADGQQLLGMGLDCNDSDPTVFVGANDFPYDGVDADCDGSSEYDLDGDGFGTWWYGTGTDCDDDDASVHPGVADACYDGLDSNCDRQDDYDCDADGHPDAAFGGDDCNDADATISPEATEQIGDGIDQNCDGSDSELCTDCDADGFDQSLDCDDTDKNVYPGAAESWYDGVDQNCDNANDYDRDADGDPVVQGGGADCDDTTALIRSTLSTDDCGRGDEDCDGTADEDCAKPGDDTAPPDDSSPPDDTAPPDDSGDSTSPATDSWRPDAEDPTDPKAYQPKGCSSAPAPVGFAAMFGLAALLRRRRNPSR
jgi:Putative metal-binding motif/FG-GAP repeat